VSIEVIDLRTLAPFDWDCIARSIAKTSRILIAHEDCLSFGYGAEISARIARELFSSLDAPVGRIGALDTWVGYNPQLEDAILPQTEDIVREAEAILDY
jgi:2-oxoisovalerate dehydrogenase E1 component